jgi:GH24 family phage-related lysozyme (muramidase)
MPKINVIPKDKTLLENTSDSHVEYADPSTWHWSYPVGLKMVGEFHFATDYQLVEGSDKKDVLYGLFSDKKLTQPICAMHVVLHDGATFGLPVKEVPVVEMVVTKEDQRGKGYGKLLYEAVLSRHNVIISDENLYTDAGKINKSLGIWLNHLTKVGDVVNLNIETKKVSSFDFKEATKSTGMRFMVLKEGMLGKLATGALATAALGMGDVSAADATTPAKEPQAQHQNFKSFSKPEAKKTDIISNIHAMLVRHEGESAKAYKDSKGHHTIGIGFNLDRKDADSILKSLGKNLSEILSGNQELNEDDIIKLFKFSLREAIVTARDVFPSFDNQPDNAKMVIIDLVFNLGKDGIKKFPNFIAAIEHGTYELAADQLMYKDLEKTQYSKWWTQVTNSHDDFETVQKHNPNNRAVEDILLLKSLVTK